MEVKEGFHSGGEKLVVVMRPRIGEFGGLVPKHRYAKAAPVKMMR